MSRAVALIGAGGHAKVVVGLLRALGVEIVAAYDDDATRRTTTVLGVPIVGPIDEFSRSGIESAVLAVGANDTRRRLAAEVQARWITLVHPSAWVDPSVQLGVGTVVCAGAAIQPDAVVGSHAIVNTGATVDHDCNVGDFAHVAPGAHLAGSVGVGEGAFLGIGCAVIPGCRVGAWSTVGAGAAVIVDIPERCTARGVPARFTVDILI